MLSSLQTGKEYRQGFVEEAIRTRITAQIHALRTKNECDYKQFAEKIGRKVAWAYRLEDPNESLPTIPTLLQIAEAFDIGLDVRFRPFSELLRDVVTLNPDSFSVPSFAEELNAGSFSAKHRRKVRRVSSRKSKKAAAVAQRDKSIKVDIGTSDPQEFALAS